MAKRIAVVESNYEVAQDFVFRMRDAVDNLYEAMRSIENADQAFCDPKMALSLKRNAVLLAGLAEAVDSRINSFDKVGA